MKALKKAWIFLLLVCLAALLSTAALAGDATSGTCGDNLTWTFDNGVLTISGEGEMNNYAAAGTPWYAYRYSITTVVIEDGVTSISNNAFYWCVNLTSVTIPNSVTSIEGNRVFYNCGSLTEILVSAENTSYTVENGVLFDKDKANLIRYPAGKAETTYEIPDGVVSIESYAFQNCVNLTSVTIPSSVISIDDWVFYECSSLTEILVSAGNTAYSTEDGVLFNGDKTELVYFPEGKGTSYIIPDGVTSIGSWSFAYGSSLTYVTIPESVTSIGSYAFNYCSGLTSITIPSSVASIEHGVFAGCDSLTDIQVSGENTAYSAEDGVLFNKDQTVLVCYPSGKTTSVYKIPESVTSIYTDAFRYCDNLTSVAIPDSVTSIGSCAFYKCSNLTNVTIPDSVTSIGSYAFDKCTNLTDVYYSGSEAEWNEIEIGSNNDYLISATIHYSSTGGDNSGSGTGDTSSETAGSVQSYIDYATSFNRCSYSDFQALGAKFTKGAWCVQFVTWCAAQSGLSDVIPYTSGTGTLFRTITNPNGSYQASGVYFGSSSASYLQYAERMTRTDYVPQAGDLIFLVWSGQNATLGHVGLVIDYNADTGRVSFVDGNAGNGIVKVRDGVSYSNLKRTDSQIVGYVRPNYDGGTRSGTVTYTFHCPIDVTVSYQGETLSSAEGILSASFGTMALDDDGITVVLDYGPAYDICVTGTDSGTMDVTVDYDLDSGASSASFTNIAVTAGTSVSVVSNIDSTTLVVSEAEEISEAWTATDGEAATEADSEALESLLNEVNTVEPDESTPGDLNGDGEVDASDLTILARHVGKVETMEDETALANADVTGDGNVDASDLTKLAQYVGKIISSLD